MVKDKEKFRLVCDKVIWSVYVIASFKITCPLMAFPILTGWLSTSILVMKTGLLQNASSVAIACWGEKYTRCLLPPQKIKSLNSETDLLLFEMS